MLMKESKTTTSCKSKKKKELSTDKEKVQELLGLMHSSFVEFVKYCFTELKLPKPTPLQLVFCKYLQHGPQKCIFQAFRGFGKTTITGLYCLWRLWLDGNTTVLIVSSNQNHAEKISKKIKDVILQLDLFSDMRPKGLNLTANSRFDVATKTTISETPSVTAMGIMSSELTGARADVIIADDIETKSVIFKPNQREQISVMTTEFDSVASRGDMRIIYLGTPHHKDTIYKTLKTRNYKTLIFPAKYPKSIAVASYDGCLCPEIEAKVTQYEGKPTDPRFDDDLLAEKHSALGATNYLLQYMLDPAAANADSYPLKIHDLIVSDKFKADGTVPVWCKWAAKLKEFKLDDSMHVSDDDKFYFNAEKSDITEKPLLNIMVIDPSGGANDETAWVVLKLFGSNIYLADLGGVSGGNSPDALNSIANAAYQNRVQKILIESNMGGDIFPNLFKPHIFDQAKVLKYNCSFPSIEQFRVTTQKEKRIIHTLEPVICSHRLIVNFDCILKDQEYETDKRLFRQMAYIMDKKGCLQFDDKLDCLASGVNYLSEYLTKDSTQALKDYEEEKRERACLEFCMRSEPNLLSVLDNLF